MFVPDIGWVDIDPTNDQFVGDRYITTAWGRDYGDVAPLKGVIFTDGDTQRLEVSVTESGSAKGNSFAHDGDLSIKCDSGDVRSLQRGGGDQVDSEDLTGAQKERSRIVLTRICR